MHLSAALCNTYPMARFPGDDTEYPDGLFDPPLPTAPEFGRGSGRGRFGGRSPSSPKADTIERVRIAMGLVAESVPVLEACGIVGVSVTSYKDIKNWMKRNLSPMK